MAKLETAKENRRKQLIDATLKAIGRVGSAVTLLQVASEAGLSPSIVNFYFKSKEQLLLATLEQITSDYATHWQAAVARGKIAPAAGLDAIIDLDFQANVCNPEKISIWYSFWSEAQSNPLYRQVISRLEAEYMAETETLCARLILEGAYDGIDPKSVATGLNALIDGLWFDCLIDPNHFSRDAAKETCRLFLSGLFPDHFALKNHEKSTDRGEVLGMNEERDSRNAHRARLAAALRRRLDPLGPLRRQALAAEMSISLRTLESWLEGRSEPSSWQMGHLIAATDAQLWIEVYGPIQEEMIRRFKARLAQAEQHFHAEHAALSVLKNEPS